MTADQTPILELKNIKKSYNAVQALKDAGLRVYPGEVHALMGGNGAGKSTLIKIIAGAHLPDEGEIILNGESIQFFKNPKDAMKHGIAVVYQELSLVLHLTVSENVALCDDSVSKAGRYDWGESDKIAEDALARLGTAAKGIKPRDVVANLRADQMQMVEIARAVGQDAKIILLDEPTSSLNFEETGTFFEMIRTLCDQGIAIIFVSHRMNEVRQLSDRITVFRDGCRVVDGVPMSEKTDDEIISDMLGQKLNPEAAAVRSGREKEKNKILLSFGFDGSDSEYSVHEGEIVGLAGLAGSGRSSVLRAIWGSSIRSDMHFDYMGKKYKPKRPSYALCRKMAYVGENRSESGLFFGQPSLETIIMAHRNLRRNPLVNDREELKIYKEVIDKIQIKINSATSSPGTLSGGNQQKLLFGRWIIDEQKLILLDEPTRGVDVRTKNEIYQRIRMMVAENNAGVLMVSSELEELVLLCDKVIIMRDGHAENVLYGDDITEANMMTYITAASEGA